jgi:hypothetical protein
LIRVALCVFQRRDLRQHIRQCVFGNFSVVRYLGAQPIAGAHPLGSNITLGNDWNLLNHSTFIPAFWMTSPHSCISDTTNSLNCLLLPS